MTLDQIIQLHRTINSLSARLVPVLDEDYREALDKAASILAEVRHFAVCWEDSVKGGFVGDERGREIRQACIDRLVQVVRPD